MRRILTYVVKDREGETKTSPLHLCCSLMNTTGAFTQGSLSLKVSRFTPLWIIRICSVKGDITFKKVSESLDSSASSTP